MALSRVGLWSFDLLERQLVQQECGGAGAEGAEGGSSGGGGEAAGGSSMLLLLSFERSLCSAGSFAVPLICLAFPRPAQFGILVMGSALATVLASGLLAAATWLQHRPAAHKHKQKVR